MRACVFILLFVSFITQSCRHDSSCTNESYYFLSDSNVIQRYSQEEKLFFNKTFDVCCSQLGQPDSLWLSPYIYFRDSDAYGCEGPFPDEIAHLEERIPGFLILSATWEYPIRAISASRYLTISFIPLKNQMVSCNVCFYDK